jgi:hypothetical protein
MQAQPTFTTPAIQTGSHLSTLGKFISLSLALGLGLLAATASQAQTTVPGKIPGQFAVSPSGAATYSIPIQVPPGIAGMEPKLSLNYNSQAGNGIMGMGWNLGGLSSITRCPATRAQDGFIGNVNYYKNDSKFCMDGQRLIIVGGAYGAAGSEYRTEIESFSKITAVGQVITSSPWIGEKSYGPTSFLVRTKSGLTMEYGATEDSRIEAQGKSAVMVWALNKITDIKGNVMTITYYEDIINPYFYPTRIDYAGNAVVFNYGTSARPDVISGYSAGSLTTMALRLNTISVLTGGVTTAVTKLQYSLSANSQRSTLSAVQLCDGATPGVCLAPLQMQWLGNEALMSSTNNSFSASLPTAYFAGGINGRSVGTQLADINGDGLPDLIQMYYPLNGDYANVPQHGVYLNNGNGFVKNDAYSASLSQANAFFVGSAGNMGTQLADLNGDGLPDLIQMYYPLNGDYANVPQHRIYLNTGSGFVKSDVFSASLAQTNMFFVGSVGNIDMGTQLSDINGDGLPDLIQLYNPSNGDYGNVPQRRVYLNNSNGFDYSASYSSTLPDMYFAGSAGKINMGTQLSDINGDGLPDLIQLYFPTNGDYGNIPQKRIYLNTGAGFEIGGSYSISLPDTWFRVASADAGTRLADLNGDGLPDLIQMYYPRNGDYNNVLQQRIYLNDGVGFVKSDTFSASLAQTNMFFVGWVVSGGVGDVNMGTQLVDINGDGLPDLVQLYYPTNGAYENQPQRRVYLNTGAGFAYKVSLSASLPDAWFRYSGVDFGTQFADLNGDGLPDLIQLYTAFKEGFDRDQRRIFLNYGTTDRISGTVNNQSSDLGIQYQSIAGNTSIYRKDNAAVYPKINLQIPLHVVSSASKTSGIATAVANSSVSIIPSNTTNYAYGGLKAELGTGRGMLGFREIRSKEVATNIRTYTEYYQDWPYIGMPKLTQTQLPGFGKDVALPSGIQPSYDEQGLLKRVSYAPACKIPLTGVACSTAPGNRYFPYVARTLEQSWDLKTGVDLSLTTTTTEYNINPGDTQMWGDPSRVTIDNGDGSSKVIVNEYLPANTTNWIAGRLKKATVTSIQP